MATVSEATDSGALQQWLIESVRSMRLTSVDSAELWLEDLRLMTDCECMCVLQGKSLTKDSTDLMFTAARSARDSINTIKGRAHVIGTEFAKLFRKVEKGRWKHTKSGALRLTCQIRSLIHECNASVTSPGAAFMEQEQQVMEECAKLVLYVDSHLDVNGNHGNSPDQASLVHMLTYLGQSFSALVDLALGLLIQNLLQIVRDNTSPHDVKATLSNLVGLGLDGEHMCYLIAKESGIDTLLSVCKDPHMEFAHAQALRAVATICCVPESIKQLDKLSGVATLTELLLDPSCPETVRAEAAGVIAQVTSPCLDQFHHLAGFIENLEDLVSSLTLLCVSSSTHEVFLLGAAALANITFMDSLACDYLLLHNTATVLIEACMLNKAESLYAKDQVATVLANMSGVESCISDITDHHGVALLVHFLYAEVDADPNEGSEVKVRSDVELAACERVLQKAAIALSRLGRDKEVADSVMELEALPRLIQLCKEPPKRNHSNAVLVACLAALRKICSVSDQIPPDLHDSVRELTKPKLMDSFIMCSNLDESIV